MVVKYAVLVRSLQAPWRVIFANHDRAAASRAALNHKTTRPEDVVLLVEPTHVYTAATQIQEVPIT